MRHVGLIPQKRRNTHVGLYVPKAGFRKRSSAPGGLGVAALPALANAQAGSGIIEDANALYQQSKMGQTPLTGSGLKLAGQGTTYSGAGGGMYMGEGISLPGSGLSLPGSGLNLPGSGLRNSIIQSASKEFDTPYAMQTATNPLGGGYASVGSRDSPMLNKIQSVLSKVIIPKMMEKFGISGIVPQSLIDKVVEVATDKVNGTVHDVILDLTKKIMPIVTQTKLAQAGVTSGGAYRKIAKSKGYKQLHGKMSNYIASELTGNQNGGDFFGDMWSGFKSVFKTVAPVLGPIASVLAPEFAPAIGAATNIIGNM